MSSERPKKKAKTANNAEVSIGGSSSGGIHLTPELIARVATFADAVCSPDMMNICLAVGPESSRTVRHCYLRKRKRFLRVTMMEFSQRNISSERACSNHLAWMKVNADWRTLAVRDKFMEKLKLACKEGGPDQTAANFVHPLIAFNNPAVAIQIGLFDSLKHIVEDKGIDINSFEWTPFNSTKRNHLLKHAVFYRNEGIFKYLLNRPGIDIRCNADDVDEDEDYPLFDIHANDVDANYPLFDSLLWLSNEEGSLDSAFLKLFMKHPEFHINGLTFHFWMKVNADWRTLAVRDKFMEKLKLACKEGGPDQTAANFVHPLIAFNNPAVAIQIGLFDSLKHIVEDKGIDINSFEWTPFNSTKRNHLLKHAVFYRNEGIFKYLLNRPGIDIRCNADDVDEDEDYPLFDIHANDVDANYPLFDSLLWLSNEEGSLDSAFLKLFMKHPEFHINGLTFHFSDSAESFTPLYCAAILCVRVLIPRQFYEKMFQTVLQGTQILLSAGANPNLRFLPHCASPIDFLRSQKATAQTGELHGSRLEDFEAREKYWDEAIALLEKHA